jgi:hypothetical protein
MKLLYLILNRAVAAWMRLPREWCEAKTQFAILFGDRFRGLMHETDLTYKITNRPWMYT